jgi:hypothetical protein
MGETPERPCPGSLIEPLAHFTWLTPTIRVMYDGSFDFARWDAQRKQAKSSIAIMISFVPHKSSVGRGAIYVLLTTTVGWGLWCEWTEVKNE